MKQQLLDYAHALWLIREGAKDPVKVAAEALNKWPEVDVPKATSMRGKLFETDIDLAELTLRIAESCAKIADDHTPAKHQGTLAAHVTGSTIAREIRALAHPIDGGKVPMSAINEIFAERKRQINQEGWTAEHDDQHNKCEMAKAAACYVLAPSPVGIEREWSYPAQPSIWPWHHSWWKPRFYRENLIRAGALIVAEIERWDRLIRRIECPNCHNANKHGDYEGTTCEVCKVSGFIERATMRLY